MNSDREDLIDFINYTDALIQDALDVMIEDIPSQTYFHDESSGGFRIWKFYVGTGDITFYPGMYISIPEPFTKESTAIRLRLARDKEFQSAAKPRVLYDWATDGFLDYGKFDTTNAYHNSIAMGLCLADHLFFVVRYGTSVVIYQCSESNFDFDPAIAFFKRHHMFFSKDDAYRVFKPVPKIVQNKNRNVLQFRMINKA